MSNQYALGRTKEERQKILNDIIIQFEGGLSLETISKTYGVTRQAISLKLLKAGYSPTNTNKKLKRYLIEDNLCKNQLAEIVRLTKKIESLQVYNRQLRKQINELKNN